MTPIRNIFPDSYWMGAEEEEIIIFVKYKTTTYTNQAPWLNTEVYWFARCYPYYQEPSNIGLFHALELNFCIKNI